jgi:hypothetical protein
MNRTIEEILAKIGEEQGWSDSSKLALVLEYLATKYSGVTSDFESFLLEQQAHENAEDSKTELQLYAFDVEWKVILTYSKLFQASSKLEAISLAETLANAGEEDWAPDSSELDSDSFRAVDVTDQIAETAGNGA